MASQPENIEMRAPDDDSPYDPANFLDHCKPYFVSLPGLLNQQMTKQTPFNYHESQAEKRTLDFKRVELQNGSFYFGEVKAGTTVPHGRGNFVDMSVPWIL